MGSATVPWIFDREWLLTTYRTEGAQGTPRPPVGESDEAVSWLEAQRANLVAVAVHAARLARA